ncbi:hypothetical protein AB0F03_20595 [Streptomyces sp. NPDC028722]|uniref:hypothetical protein n=1 Tax=Streptomyces sp. NPDC028722 TaxID=3155016 RepID=UPI0033D4BA73
MVHTIAIRIRLEERPIPIQARYERVKSRFDCAFNRASSAITNAAQELAERRVLNRTITDHGLRRPVPRCRRSDSLCRMRRAPVLIHRGIRSGWNAGVGSYPVGYAVRP